ncbi:MAG: hypothetical protein H7336_11510 [Bacteriovorax sp.]|nr:hypothetical protein [Bacteriovorax sp.]
MYNRQKSIGFIAALILLISVQARASDVSSTVVNAIETGNFAIGIGSTVNLKSNDPNISGPAVFIGSTVKPDGTNSYQMYLNTKSKTVYYIQPENFTRLNPVKQQKVLDSYEQAGGTCSAYAINNFLQQTNLTGFEGSGELQKAVSTEEGRTNLLADAINEYYLTTSHQYSLKGIMNKYGKKFGFSCNKLQTDSFEKASALILSHVKLGLPVIVSFSIGPAMAKSPFALEIYDQPNGELDNRLWIPRKTGERNSGGHSITAVGSFEANKKTYLVMIDSDWSEPRVWDMEAFLHDPKTALNEMEFITCE